MKLLRSVFPLTTNCHQPNVKEWNRRKYGKIVKLYQYCFIWLTALSPYPKNGRGRWVSMKIRPIQCGFSSTPRYWVCWRFKRNNSMITSIVYIKWLCLWWKHITLTLNNRGGFIHNNYGTLNLDTPHSLGSSAKSGGKLLVCQHKKRNIQSFTDHYYL